MLTDLPTRGAFVADRRFGAMGSDAHIIVVGDTSDAAYGGLDTAVARVEQLEARWSRFRASSEISQLNTRLGAPVLVSRDTYRLVEHAVRAWELTEGRYDPTVIDAMLRIGYDRDFAAIGTQPRSDPPHSVDRPVLDVAGAAPGCGAVRLDSYLPAVTLPAGVGFDPGGIGKGLAADVVVNELIAAGACGAMVNLGGDVAVAGQPPDVHGWIVGIEDPNDSTRHIARVTLEAGGVCTSSRRRRAWTAADGRRVHHLIDPRDGCPIDTPIVSITVVAGAAWWAEATTKAGFVAGTEGLEAQLAGAYALVVLDDGSIEIYGDRGVFDLDSDAILEASGAT